MPGYIFSGLPKIVIDSRSPFETKTSEFEISRFIIDWPTPSAHLLSTIRPRTTRCIKNASGIKHQIPAAAMHLLSHSFCHFQNNPYTSFLITVVRLRFSLFNVNFNFVFLWSVQFTFEAEFLKFQSLNFRILIQIKIDEFKARRASELRDPNLLRDFLLSWKR